MNRQLLEIASWRIVSELIRRYPEEFILIETHPCDGQMDCLSLFARRGRTPLHIADFNRAGNLNVFNRFDGNLESFESFEIWERIIGADDLKDILDEICIKLGLKIPKGLPPSTPEVLVYRFIAAFLSHAVFGRRTWECRNGFFDSSGYSGSSITSDFKEFPEAEERLQKEMESDFMRNPAYRFWFLLKNRKPVVCLETSGRVWTENGQSFELMPLYRTNRKVWPLVMKAAGDYLP